MEILKNFIKLFLKSLNIKLIRYGKDGIRAECKKYLNLNYSEYDKELNGFIKNSMSQYGQDYFINILLNKKESGYYVEFGAIDGIINSNSYFFEKFKSYNGIVCEPAVKYHKALRKNRNCKIETLCLAEESNKIYQFIETTNWPGGNTLKKYIQQGVRKRNIDKTYDVKTISLIDMLIKHEAPSYIDFISIDTEGSEYDILKKFNFDRFKFGIILVEHAFETEKKNKIKNLLQNNNYVEIIPKFIIDHGDSWYVSKEILQNYKSLINSSVIKKKLTKNLSRCILNIY